jgi:predicted nucleotidyltransferase
LYLIDADKEQIDHTLTLMRVVLQSEVVGVYLFGSAVFGGLRPDSDLDILVVSNRPTTRTEKQRLVQDLMTVSGKKTSRGILRRIELTIVVERDIRPWKYPPSFDFQYGDWLRDKFERGNVEPWSTKSMPDLAVLITMVLLADTPILGPRPSEVFDPVPYQDLLHAMLSDIDRLRVDINSDTRNVLLTLARTWSTAATGIIRSKDAAVEWILEYLPESHRAIIARARAIYLGVQAERWDDVQEDLVPCVDYLIAEISRNTNVSEKCY